MKFDGKALQKLRQIRKWTQKDLAKEMKVSTHVIGRWERNINTPHPVQLQELRVVFKAGDEAFMLPRVEPEAPAPRKLGSELMKMVMGSELLTTIAKLEIPTMEELVRLRVELNKPAAVSTEDGFYLVAAAHNVLLHAEQLRSAIRAYTVEYRARAVDSSRTGRIPSNGSKKEQPRAEWGATDVPV